MLVYEVKPGGNYSARRMPHPFGAVHKAHVQIRSRRI